MYKNKFSYENTTKFIFEGEGIFNIPIINATDNIDNLENLIGFNYAMSSKKKDCGVHFFLDDYQFQRLWNNPEKYIEVLMKYPFVLSPDFSLYSDYPRALQIYNHYKKHWLAAREAQKKFQKRQVIDPTLGYSRTTTTYENARKRIEKNFEAWWNGSSK